MNPRRRRYTRTQIAKALNAQRLQFDRLVKNADGSYDVSRRYTDRFRIRYVTHWADQVRFALQKSDINAYVTAIPHRHVGVKTAYLITTIFPGTPRRP